MFSCGDFFSPTDYSTNNSKVFHDILENSDYYYLRDQELTSDYRDLFPEIGIDICNQECSEAQEAPAPSCNPLHDHNYAKRYHEEVAINEDYECEHCEQTFPEKCLLKKHKRIHCFKDLFTCDYCVFGFITERELKVHMLKIHKEREPYKCPLCLVRFLTFVKFKKHFNRCVDVLCCTNYMPSAKIRT